MEAACTRIWCVRPVPRCTSASTASGNCSSGHEMRDRLLAVRIDPHVALAAAALVREQRGIDRARRPAPAADAAARGSACRCCRRETGHAGRGARPRAWQSAGNRWCPDPVDAPVRDSLRAPGGTQQFDGPRTDTAAAVDGQAGRLVQDQQVRRPRRASAPRSSRRARGSAGGAVARPRAAARAAPAPRRRRPAGSWPGPGDC